MKSGQLIIRYNIVLSRNYYFRTGIVLPQEGLSMTLRIKLTVSACIFLAIVLSCDTSRSPVQPGPSPESILPTARASVIGPGPYFSVIPVLFNASESTDNDDLGDGKLVFEWEWESGTGYSNPSENPEVAHTWFRPGTYEVNLRITDDEGETDMLDTPLIVEVLDGTIPYPKAGSSAHESLVFDEIEFFDDGSFVAAGTPIASFEWDWDFDGVYDEEGKSISHYWPDPGLYIVGYRVTTENGKSSELKNPLEVRIDDVFINPTELPLGSANMNITDYAVESPYLYFLDFNHRFRVFDISDLSTPIPAGLLPLDEGFESMCVDGNRAFVANRDHGLPILAIDIEDPLNPEVTEALDGTAYLIDIVTKNDHLYGAANDGSLYVVDVGPTASHGNVKLFDEIAHSPRLKVNGDSLVVISGSKQAYVYDISDSWNPELLQVFYFENVSDVVLRQSDGYLFCLEEYKIEVLKVGSLDTVALYDPGLTTLLLSAILSEGGKYLFLSTRSKVLVLDVANPALPVNVGTLPVGALPIEMRIDKDRLFVFSSDSDRMDVFNIAALPAAPRLGGFRGLTNAHDIVSAGDFSYAADFLIGLSVVDTRIPANLLVHATLNLIRTNTVLLNEDTLLVTYVNPPVSAHDFPFYLIDVSDPANPTVMFLTDLGFSPNAIAMSDDYAFFGDMAGNRIEVWDIDPPASSFKVGEFNTSSYIYSMKESNGYLYIATDRGVEIFDSANPHSPAVVAVLGDDLCYNLETFNNRLFMLMRSGSNLDLFATDISDPSEPAVFGSVRVGDFLYDLRPDLAFSHGYVCVSRYGIGIDCFDVQPPESPSHVWFVEENECYNIDIYENTLYAACGYNDLRRFKLW